jgi:hypothetical protein
MTSRWTHKHYDPRATKDSVRSKINNSRSTFRKELKEVTESKRSGASADDFYAPKLWYFDSLLFTADQEQPRKGILAQKTRNGEAEFLSNIYLKTAHYL